MVLWRTSLDSIGISFGIIIVLVLLGKAEAQSNRKDAWDRTVRAAEEEGRLTVYGSSAHERLFRLFNKEYPEIKVTFVGGRGSNSMREDISKDDVHFSLRRVKGVELNRPGFHGQLIKPHV